MDEDKIWILTFEQNEYNQYGEYLLSVFKNKPHELEIAPFVWPDLTEDRMKDLLNKGMTVGERTYYLIESSLNKNTFILPNI